MNRRLALMALLAGGSCASLAGCLRSEEKAVVRKSAGRASAEEPLIKYSGEEDESEAAKPPRGFFKSTRLPGALSAEGSEIERDLGIGR